MPVSSPRLPQGKSPQSASGARAHTHTHTCTHKHKHTQPQHIHTHMQQLAEEHHAAAGPGVRTLSSALMDSGGRLEEPSAALRPRWRVVRACMHVQQHKPLVCTSVCVHVRVCAHIFAMTQRKLGAVAHTPFSHMH